MWNVKSRHQKYYHWAKSPWYDRIVESVGINISLEYTSTTTYKIYCVWNNNLELLFYTSGTEKEEKIDGVIFEVKE